MPFKLEELPDAILSKTLGFLAPGDINDVSKFFDCYPMKHYARLYKKARHTEFGLNNEFKTDFDKLASPDNQPSLLLSAMFKILNQYRIKHLKTSRHLARINQLKSDINVLFRASQNSMTKNLGYLGQFDKEKEALIDGHRVKLQLCEHTLPDNHCTDTILKGCTTLDLDITFSRKETISSIHQNKSQQYFYLALRLEFEMHYAETLAYPDYQKVLNNMLNILFIHTGQAYRENLFQLCHNIGQQIGVVIKNYKSDTKLWNTFYVWQLSKFSLYTLPKGNEASQKNEQKEKEYANSLYKEKTRLSSGRYSRIEKVPGTTSSLRYFFPQRNKVDELVNLSRHFKRLAVRLQKVTLNEDQDNSATPQPAGTLNKDQGNSAIPQSAGCLIQ